VSEVGARSDARSDGAEDHGADRGKRFAVQDIETEALAGFASRTADRVPGNSACTTANRQSDQRRSAAAWDGDGFDFRAGESEIFAVSADQRISVYGFQPASGGIVLGFDPDVRAGGQSQNMLPV
jgi:hypothetical protein